MLPHGYELSSENIDGDDATLIYTDDNGEIIIIHKYGTEASLNVDTEDAEYKEIMIADYQGFYSIKNGTIVLANGWFSRLGYIMAHFYISVYSLFHMLANLAFALIAVKAKPAANVLPLN